MRHLKCPCCNSLELDDFYVVKNAPIQSMVTIKTYEEAISVPKNDITLVFCNECGFIFNRSFDVNFDYYTAGYEDQQGFSPTFIKFITTVTNKFIDKYNVREKDIIEIGCGKGDFLNLICDLGNNRGIGIDPSYVPGRSEPNNNVSFIKEFYSEVHGELPMDVIACRHTLEHISNAREFVNTIRSSINGDKNITVLIEVPNIIRILNIQAFWDIFNEHCSYFSQGSLARLFKKNGFNILNTYLEYEDQYLFLEASTTQEIQSSNHSNEETVEQLRKYVDDFVVKINVELEKWNEILIKLKGENKKVALWGGGSKSIGFLTQFNDLNVIKHVVDINPYMQGNYIPAIGMQYVSPKFLTDFKPDTIIVMNGVYKEEIRKMLSEMNLFPELICL